MDFIKDLTCPQFVNLSSNISVLTDFNPSPSGSSILDYTSCKSDDMIEENGAAWFTNNESITSESNLADSSCQEASQSTVTASFGIEDFPVRRPNISLPETKKSSKASKTTFHFMEPKKRKRENEELEYIPMAERVLAFHKKTPERFHTTGLKSFEPQQNWSPPHLVRPKSPNLRAAKRIRGVDAISREEEELKEAEEMKKYKFRARPVNKKVLLPPCLDRARKKTPTKGQVFNLRTAQRAAEVAARRKSEEKPYKFQARPVPKAILSGPTGIKPKSSLPRTEPKTPNFQLKSRAAKWNSQNNLDSTSMENKVFKAQPVPDPSSPFLVKHEKKSIEIQPFSFDAKDKERMAKKEQKIKEEIEKANAVYEFKAQPMPSPTPSVLPAVEKKENTNPMPFNFHLEGRNLRSNSFDFSMDQTSTNFKARPAKVLEKPPFVPEKPGKHTVDIAEFNLQTDIRAVERQKLKEINDIKEHEKELAVLRLKQLQEEQERQEIARFRKEIVHKAQPIKHFKTVEIKPSTKPPTEPISPKFKTDERLQQPHQV